MHLIQAHVQRVRQYSPALSIRWHIRLTWVAAQSYARSTPEERNMRCSCSKNIVRHSYIFVTFPFLLFFPSPKRKAGKRILGRPRLSCLKRLTSCCMLLASTCFFQTYLEPWSSKYLWILRKTPTVRLTAAPALVVHTYNFGTGEVEVGGSGVWVKPELQS